MSIEGDEEVLLREGPALREKSHDGGNWKGLRFDERDITIRLF
jgi:hypothetical protein